MQITEKEIDTIEEIGTLDGHGVKLIRTKGGFYIACGKPKGKFREEALCAGSHSAIVKFNLERQHPSFQPSMMKSEFLTDGAIVEKHSHFLSDDLRKSGFDIYSVQDGPTVNFHITKQNSDVAVVNGNFENQFLVVKSLSIPKEFSKAMAGATVEKALSCKVGMKVKL
jgi:hypothetical protein